MRISKKIAAVIISVVMIFATMPVTALATDYSGAVVPFDYEVEIWNEGDWPDWTFEQIGYETPESYSELFVQARWEIKEDIVVDKPIVIPAGANVQINLNGHSISGNIADSDGKKLIQVIGTLEFIGNSGGCIYNTNVAGQGHAACQALSGGTVTVSSPIHFGDSDTDMTNANAVNRGCGIQNNGGTLIINDGYYTAIDANYSTGAWAYAILNCEGDTIVNNATVYGNYLHGALGCEEGTLTVNDGTFTVSGANNYYSLYNDGGTITVNGGTFSDNSKYGVNYLGTGAETTITGGDFDYSATTPFVQSSSASNPVVSGGTYSAAVPEACCAPGFVPEYDSETGTYGVTDKYVAKVGNTYYEDFEDAVAAARTGSDKTVTVINDVDLTSYPAKGQHRIDISNVTIDLNQHTFTASGRWGILFEGTNATIKNGTMEAIDNSDAVGYQYGVYVWGRDGSDEMPDPAQKAEVTLEDLTINYGIHTYNAEVTVKNCDVTGSSKYYAIWADCESTVNVESGNFTTGGAAVVGTAQYQNTLFGHIDIEGGNFVVPAGKKLVQTGSSCKKENTQFSGGTAKYANGSVYTILEENLAPHFVQDTTTGGVYQGDANDGTNITVADTISESFYLDGDFYGETSYVAVEYNHNSDVTESPSVSTEIKAMSTLPVYDDESSDYDGNRIVSITQAPAQITEDIVITIYPTLADANAGTNALNTITYSTYDYCRSIITGSYPEDLKDLAEATLDYAAAAQMMFNYNTSNMATKDASGDFYNDIDAADFSEVQGFTALPACVTSATMVVKSELEINLLANAEVTINGASITNPSGSANFEVTTQGWNGDYFVIHVSGIEAVDMNNVITIDTSAGDISFTANSVMQIFAGSSKANLATLAKAMFLYGKAADNYFV